MINLSEVDIVKFMERWPQLKTQEELKEQLDEAEKTIKTKLEPADFDKTLSLEEVKQKYPERYSVYLRLLRTKKSGNEIDVADLKSMSEWISGLNNLDDYIENHKINENERILRSKQFTIFEDIRTSLEQGRKEGYIKLPTGVGKTVLFSQVLQALKLKSLVVVPSKILVNQTGQKIEEFTDIEFGKYYQEAKDLSKNVTITTYSSLVLATESGSLTPKDFEVLILDEAHKALGPKTMGIVDKFDCVKLGFTATPEYSKKKHVEKILENKIHDMTIVEAVREGLISRFKSVFAFTETDISNVPIAENGEYDEKILEKTINTTARNLSAVQLYKEMFPGQSAIAYCTGVRHANDLAGLLNEKEVKSAVISGKTSPQERKELLGKFKNGEIQVLCNAKLLIEGFDEPRANVAINLHPTFSMVDAEQRAGRVLRLDKDNPDKWGYIVDFIDKNSQKDAITFPEIAMLSEAQYRVPPEFFDKETRDKIAGEEGVAQLPHPVIEGLKVIVDAKEILSISKQFLENRVEIDMAPAGWLNANEIAKKFGFNHGRVKSKVTEIKNDHVNWFVDHKAPTGKIFEYISPQAIELIVDAILKDRQHLDVIDVAPAGWLTFKMLTRKGKASYETVEKELLKYKVSHAHWIKMYKTPSHKVLEHYSPELSNMIIEEINKNRAEEGWSTATALRDVFHVSEITIKKFFEQYKSSHSQWFKSFKNGDYYHPDLVLLAQKHFPAFEIEHAPDGWMSASHMVTQYGYTYETVKNRAEQYRSENPGWFKKSKTRTKVVESFHPDLVKKIRDWCEERKSTPHAPDGWMNSYALALEFKRDTLKVKSIAEPYRRNCPDWFKKFKAGKSMISEFYHPELVQKIREDFKKSR